MVDWKKLVVEEPYLYQIWPGQSNQCAFCTRNEEELGESWRDEEIRFCVQQQNRLQMIFVGYDATHYGFPVFDPESKRIAISRDVVFDETKFQV